MSIKRRATGIRSHNKRYVISTEGEKTEKIYFEFFSGNEYRKIIKILPAKNGKSSPSEVFNRLISFRASRDYNPSIDELWAVIDFDDWGFTNLKNFCTNCASMNINIAISNPYFELWLILHQNKCPNLKSKSYTTILNKIFGEYNKNQYSVQRIKDKIINAISHAESRDSDKEEDIFQLTGTRVYKLVKKLVSSN